VGAPAVVDSSSDLLAHLHMAEDAGYSVATFPDHLFLPLAPFAALGFAAATTSRLRLGTLLLANDLRAPAVAAKELATLDLLSGGRLEVGLGAGWMERDFLAAGLPFHPAPSRIARLEEAVAIMRGAWSGTVFDVDGEHYQLSGLVGRPQPLQPGGPPLVLGGGMRRILTLAGAQADVVTVASGAMGFAPDAGRSPRELLAQRVTWVTEASANRASFPELHILLSGVAITTNRRDGVRESAQILATSLGSLSPGRAAPLDEEMILDSPFNAIGTVEQICDQLRQLRDDLGISYFSVMEPFGRAFAPVVEALAGR
jgi:probable F420-dependent oxidoreductase